MPLPLGFKQAPRTFGTVAFAVCGGQKAADFMRSERLSKKFSMGACVEPIPVYNARPAFPISQILTEGLDSARVWSYNSGLACRVGQASLFNNLSQATCVGARKSNSARAYADGCLHPEV